MHLLSVYNNMMEQQKKYSVRSSQRPLHQKGHCKCRIINLINTIVEK